MLLAHQNVAVRVSSFALEDRWLFWARARLYADRIELRGWFFWGHYHRTVPLGHIDAVEATDRRLVLHLADGSVRRVLMDAPEQWASAIETYRDVRKVAE